MSQEDTNVEHSKISKEAAERQKKLNEEVVSTGRAVAGLLQNYTLAPSNGCR
jgi:hypothetical protein